jgi:hypothetical protein
MRSGELSTAVDSQLPTPFCGFFDCGPAIARDYLAKYEGEVFDSESFGI